MSLDIRHSAPQGREVRFELGPLVWIAEGFWEEEPTADDVATAQWRWCVFFPLGVALRQRVVFPLGRTDIPAELARFPTMRGGSREQGWFLAQDGNPADISKPTTDASLPPRILVTDVRLKEMLVSGWRPPDMW